MKYVPVNDEASFLEVTRELTRVSHRLTRAQAKELISANDAQRLLHHIRCFGHALRRIRRFALESYSASRLKTEVNRALRSHHARIAATLAVSGCLDAATTFDEVDGRAQTICLHNPCNDPVAVKVKDKPGGGLRLVCAFGWRNKSRQWLLYAVLVAAGVGSEFDMNTKGIGANVITDAIKTEIERGHRYWVIADIKNCFPTVKQGHLEGIAPISLEGLQSVIFIPTQAPIQLSHNGKPIGNKDLEKEARLGLPQGSKLSSLLASAVLGRELRALVPAANPAASFGDDIAMGARKYEDAKNFKHALLLRLSSLKAGPLQLKHCEIYDARKGVIYIGRKHRLRWWDGKQEVRVTLSNQSHERMFTRACKEFPDKLLALSYDDEPNALDEYIARALSGYGMQASAAQIYDLKTRMHLKYLRLMKAEAAHA